MRNIKKVMAAVDLSDYSPDVLDYAGTLCSLAGAELLIVNVINQRDLDAVQKMQIYAADPISVEEVVSRQKTERQEKIQSLIQKLELTELPLEVSIRIGLPHQELIKAAKEEQVQLVVMGPKGHGNVPGLLLGSAAEKMFQHCPIPLLSIRGEHGSAS